MRQYKRAITFLLVLAVVIALFPENYNEKEAEAASAATPTPIVTMSPSPTPSAATVPTIRPETGAVETAVPTVVPTASPLVSAAPVVTPVSTPVITPAPVTEEIRGVWIAFYEYKKAGLKNKSEAVFRKNADKLFKRIKENGCNAVFFHVRAFDDAIWPAENFKFSSYMGKKTPN